MAEISNANSMGDARAIIRFSGNRVTGQPDHEDVHLRELTDKTEYAVSGNNCGIYFWGVKKLV